MWYHIRQANEKFKISSSNGVTLSRCSCALLLILVRSCISVFFWLHFHLPLPRKSLSHGCLAFLSPPNALFIVLFVCLIASALFSWQDVNYRFLPGAPQEHYRARKILEQLIVNSLHRSYVIHCASRNCTRKPDFFCVMDGVGHCIENYWGTYVRCHYIKLV